MKTGILERVLTRRYGKPLISTSHDLPARCWKLDDQDFSAVLYVGMTWTEPWNSRFASLKGIYGDVFGGFLVKNNLKVAVLLPREVWGLRHIDELRIQPAVRRALTRDPAVNYFMDQDIVFFYGIKGGQLYILDTRTDEVDSLGPIEPALEAIMDEMDAAREDA